MGVEVVGEAVMVGEAAVTEWAEVELKLLSRVVMHSADSQAGNLVRDSAGCGYFTLADFLAAEMMAVSGIATLGTMGISKIRTNGIIAISSTILISWRSAFLIGGTLITDTSTTDTPIKMRTMILDRLTVTSIGKIWR